MQRGLIFDFPNDPNKDIIYNNPSNQFMFGPNLLISPVFDDNNITNVYLPTNNVSNKYIGGDFWTG